MTHAAVPLAIARAAGRRRVPLPLMITGVALSMLPDLDVIAFRLGIPYAASFGHRGATHSLPVAVAVSGALAALLSFGVQRLTAFAVLLASMASHGLLDTLTTGGLGISLLWPLSDVRIFSPWRPIAVSPIGAAFFSGRGLRVLASELVWVWLPLATVALGLAWRKRWSARC